MTFDPAVVIDFAGKIVIGVLLAIWLYRDARSRDFSWLMWTISPAILLFCNNLSWILPAILIPVIYLGTRPRGSILQCPHCKKKVHEELAFCPFCRRSVKRECLHCHRTVPWDAVVCPHCRSSALTDS